MKHTSGDADGDNKDQILAGPLNVCSHDARGLELHSVLLA